MSQESESLISIEKTIVTAVDKLGNLIGASLKDIQYYLSANLDEIPDLKSIQWYLNCAVDKEVLKQLDDGNYMINEAANSAIECFHNAMCFVDGKVLSNLDIGKDKIEKYAEPAKEVTKDTKNNFKEEFYENQINEENNKTKEKASDFQDENMNLDPENVYFSAQKDPTIDGSP